MRHFNFNRVIKRSLLLFSFILVASGLKAQLTGIKTIPADYASIALFVTDVNTQGVGAGGVTLNVPAGYTETSTGVISLTATGTITNPIIIQKFGAGANPIITSYTGGTGTPGTAVQDGIFALVGSDYVLIDGIDLTENAANTTNPSTMEYGFGLFKASVTDGCQFNVIRNCVVTLNRVNNASGTAPAFDGSRGINVVNSLITTQTTVVTVTAASGSNSNNQFYANTIQNANIGIAISGFAAASPFTLSDTGNDVGGSALATGNTILNFGGAPTATNPSAGIRTSNQQTLNVSYNTVNNNNGSGVDHVSTLRGILIGASTSANATINNNTIVLRSGATTSLLAGIDNASGSTAASNTININNNLIQLAYPTSTSAIVNGIINSGTATTVNINSNTIEGIAATFLAGTGTLVMIETGSPTTANTNNNIVRNINRNAASGSWRIIKTTSPGTWIANGNLIENLSWTNTASTGSIDGIYSLSSAVNVTYLNNIVRNLSTPTTGTINGLREFGVSGTKLIQNNEIYNFSTTAGGAGGATFNGISVSTGTVSIIGNKVYALNSTGTAGGTGGGVNGILCSGGTSCSASQNKIYDLSSTSTNPVVAGISFTGGGVNAAYNNTISDLRTPAANAANPLIGINFNGGTSGNAFYNSVLLNGTSSGALFGSSAISASTGVTVILGNNIFINLSTPNGATGFTSAYRRSSTALATYNNASNRNLFYAGVPGANRLLLYDGTNSYQTMLAYQTAVAPRDLNSLTGEAFVYDTPGSFFISLTGSSADFLKPVGGITTQVESGAANITTPIAITTDYANVTRAGNVGYAGTGSNPDCGAYEFEGISPAPVITLNSVTPGTTTQCVAAARVVSVNITTTAGTITGANLFYAINGVPQTNIAMTNPSGSTWTATIPVPAPVNATIAWGVTATNSIGLNSSYVGTTYADEPLFGSTAAATASSTTVCAGSPSTLTATITKPGSIQLGTATSTTSTDAITPFTSNWEGSRRQYLIRASELQALGLGAGNINSMAFIVTAAGIGTFPQSNYVIKMGHTSTNAMASAYVVPSGAFTTVFTAASEPAPAVGTRTYNFSTPFNWDGVSNVLIDICHDNDIASSCASCFSGNSTVQFSVTPFNSVWGSFADNVQSCGVQAANVTSTFTNRPNMIFTGTVATPITSVTWMDGVTTVGTGNPLAVNPTATTTYTANITALGCAAAPSPTVTVTVNPLPAAPTATNSAQCGTQIPTASVTSTSGLPTPTFVWYSLPVAGVVMQSSTSTTYTSNVTATTTFYVSELNTVTGCESTRTPVTVTVATADGVSANASAPTICIGSSITLTAANTNPTPNQSYTYTWSSTANSGASTPVAGSPAVITPTQPGTYTYNLAAVDGGCNAVATVNVTVNPFVATLAPINVSCNGYNNGSFSVASSSCGTLPYTYSIGGGAFGAIPTNLAPGTYSVVVQDDNGYLVAAQNVVITEPSTTIAAPTGTNATVCQGDLTAPVSASSVTNAPTPASVVVNFTIATQPTELSASTTPATVAASPNAIATATMAALPAGAVVTGATLNYNNIVALGNSWQSDVRLGLVGAVTQNYTAGSAVNGAGTFNYASTIPAGSVNVAGGTITMHYFDFFNDNAGAESTFPTGSNVASITINYTVPTPASITWWTASSAGTQIGSGSPFETVGTSVLPNTNTPGVYTVYAQGEFGGCNGLTRTPVTVTVNAPSASTTTITACGSYMWTNGTTYTASGIHTQTLVNAAGCDSIATLNLTINQPTSSSVTVSACSSYTWAQNGTTYTTSGSYPVVLAGANAAGCDSTVTLNLTINQPTSSTVTVSACGSYTWSENTTTYTVSGSYPVVLAGANANGCDSTVTLNLTINQPTSSTVTVTACGSYTWAENTTTYTTSGSYPVVLAGANANGCDSTVTLNLTINQPTSSTVTEVACGSYTWAENGTTYTASGSYPVVLAGANANGCDSTITLNLTINQPTSSTVTEVACGSYTWAENGTTYTASGSYPVVLAGASANGCDSTVTLVLTIVSVPTATATDNGDATITASAGGSYQWIDCATNTAIAGATSQTYTATVNGDYAVVVTNAGGCSDTSSCVTIDYIGLTENTDASIQVFPNPTNSDVTITMTATEASVEVVDAQGKILQAVTVSNGEKVNLSTYETGVYFLRIRTVNGSTLERVVKQQ